MNKLANKTWDITSLRNQYLASALFPVSPVLESWARAEALLFEKNGFPKRQQEDWKYTDTQMLAQQTFSLPKPAQNVSTPFVWDLTDSFRMVFINGYFQSHLSQLVNLPLGLQMVPMALALQSEHSIIETLRTPVCSTNFTHLNAALLADGWFIRVNKNTHLDKPLHLVYINTAAEKVINNPRNCIYIEEGSEVNILEEYSSTQTSEYFNNVVTHIHCGANSRLGYYKLQRENSSATHIAHTSILQEKDSVLQSASLAVGGKLVREDLNVKLVGANAQCELLGLYSLNGKRHVDNHTRIYHEALHTVSQQDYLGILTDQATGVFNGKIAINSQARKSKAKQFNRNLLLSSQAEIYTKPQLEINNEDVQCSHGATVGPLDQGALFYLQSRGIAKDLAVHMLKQAFLESLFEKIHRPLLKSYLQKHLEAGCYEN